MYAAEIIKVQWLTHWVCVGECVLVGCTLIICDAEIKGNYWNVTALMGHAFVACSQVRNLTFTVMKHIPHLWKRQPTIVPLCKFVKNMHL